MLRFVVRGVLFLSILFLIGWFGVRLSKTYPSDDAIYRHLGRVQATIADIDSVEIMLLGNSHIRYGIEPALLPGVTRVIGLHWNDLFEVRHQVQTLLPRAPRLRTVIISVSYYSFHWDNALGDDDYYLSSRKLFYAEQPRSRWIPGDFRNFALAQTYWLARPDHWYNVIRGLRHGIEWESGENPIRTVAELEQDAQRRIDDFTRSMAVMLEQREDLVDRTYAALAETIGLLKDHGVDVLLVTPPHYEGYHELLRDLPVRLEMPYLAQRIAEEHGIIWVDAGNNGLSFESHLFRDSDHLNQEGRQIFTQWLSEEYGPEISAPRRGAPRKSHFSVSRSRSRTEAPMAKLAKNLTR
jgi:hypothetical protein